MVTNYVAWTPKCKTLEKKEDHGLQQGEQALRRGACTRLPLCPQLPQSDCLSYLEPRSLLTSTNWNTAKSHRRPWKREKRGPKVNKHLTHLFNASRNSLRQVLSWLPNDEETETQGNSKPVPGHQL